jgi:hypothetical protein
VCDWTWYRAKVNEANLKKFFQNISESQIVRGSDTADTGWFIANVASTTNTAASLNGATFDRLWWGCLAFRRFSNPDTWKDMEQAVLAVPEPDWEGVRDALQRRYDNEQKIFGGTFYASGATLATPSGAP